jgi:hypothetical protein
MAPTGRTVEYLISEKQAHARGIEGMNDGAQPLGSIFVFRQKDNTVAAGLPPFR